jgi:hypothetical protein
VTSITAPFSRLQLGCAWFPKTLRADIRFPGDCYDRDLLASARLFLTDFLGLDFLGFPIAGTDRR